MFYTLQLRRQKIPASANVYIILALNIAAMCRVPLGVVRHGCSSMFHTSPPIKCSVIRIKGSPDVFNNGIRYILVFPHRTF